MGKLTDVQRRELVYLQTLTPSNKTADVIEQIDKYTTQQFEWASEELKKLYDPLKLQEGLPNIDSIKDALQVAGNIRLPDDPTVLYSKMAELIIEVGNAKAEINVYLMAVSTVCAKIDLTEKLLFAQWYAWTPTSEKDMGASTRIRNEFVLQASDLLKLQTAASSLQSELHRMYNELQSMMEELDKLQRTMN